MDRAAPFDRSCSAEGRGRSNGQTSAGIDVRPLVRANVAGVPGRRRNVAGRTVTWHRDARRGRDWKKRSLNLGLKTPTHGCRGDLHHHAGSQARRHDGVTEVEHDGPRAPARRSLNGADARRNLRATRQAPKVSSAAEWRARETTPSPHQTKPSGFHAEELDRPLSSEGEHRTRRIQDPPRARAFAC